MLFKKIISVNLVTIITYYTNKRIQNIQTALIQNEDYRRDIDSMKSKPIIIMEIFDYIGLLILYGLSNKNEISIESLWSDQFLIHYCPYASVALSRKRFQLISRYISFDDFYTRKNREHNKFHKMEATFNMFKKNLNLIIPSYFLCIDETLFKFRGCCSFRIFQVNQLVMVLSIGVWWM